MKRAILILLLAAAGSNWGLALDPDPQERAERAAERQYDAGKRALDKQQWENAIEAFREVPRTSARADGALYWIAYSQNKLGRRSEALAALAEMQKSFPQSRWLSDAKALEVEVRQAQGQPVRPEAESDEELKIWAINSLMQADAERAVPMLENVLKSNASPKLKDRALFVLIQSGSPRARQMVADFARGSANPDLQRKAISYLGVFQGRDSAGTLVDIYKASTDPSVKRQVLDALFVGHVTDKMAELARSEKDPKLRVAAIEKLGLMGKDTAKDLSDIYTSDPDPRVRKAVLNAFFLQHNTAVISELAKKESDPELRKEAIQKLGIMGNETAGELIALYNAETDRNVRKAVLNALFIQHNATALINIAKTEKDPELKKDAVQKLSIMGGKEATDYMMEILK